MPVKLAIIYYSSTGTTFQMASEMEKAAKEKGVEVRLRKVKEFAPDEAINSNKKWKKHLEDTAEIPEAKLEDLEWANALIFGTPTRYGQPAAQLKNFMDQTGPLWAKGKLADKICSSFVTAATAHGGHESTLLAINNTLYHWGAIIAGPGYINEHQFKTGNPYGASFTSNNGELDPDEPARKAARIQAERIIDVARKLNE